MSLDRYFKRSKSEKDTQWSDLKQQRHHAEKKKKNRFLLSLSTPFREVQHHNEEYKEEWMKFLNGYTENRKPVISSLFSGYSFYFDGYLGEKTRLELVEMVMTHGGDVEHFYSVSRVSIIIARNLCYSKIQQYRKKPSIRVIDPSWIIDSIKENKLQPFSKYSVLKEKIGSIDKFFYNL